MNFIKSLVTVAKKVGSTVTKSMNKMKKATSKVKQGFKAVKKIKDKFRFQIVCRFSTEKETEILNQIFKIVENIQDKNIQVFIETNPQNLS